MVAASDAVWHERQPLLLRATSSSDCVGGDGGASEEAESLDVTARAGEHSNAAVAKTSIAAACTATVAVARAEGLPTANLLHDRNDEMLLCVYTSFSR